MGATYRTGESPTPGDRVRFPASEALAVPGEGLKVVEVRREGVLVSAHPEAGEAVVGYAWLETLHKGTAQEVRFLRTSLVPVALAQCEKL